MDELITLTKNVGPKMVPFVKSVVIYFLLISFEQNGQVWSTIIKCAPIICLIIFVLLYDMQIISKEFSYSHKILLGLIFSCIGDALLNIDLFAHGMASFAIAQIFYVTAFGFKRIRLWIGLLLYSLGTIGVLIFYKNINNLILSIGLPVYTFLLLTMCWRAIARVDSFKDNSNLTKITCAIGSVLFVASDAFIAFDMFYTTIPSRTIWVMTTYYAAQFGITLSIVSAGGAAKIGKEKLNYGERKSVHSQTDEPVLADNIFKNSITSSDNSDIRLRKSSII